MTILTELFTCSHSVKLSAEIRPPLLRQRETRLLISPTLDHEIYLVT
jgi:hypothetical protein